MGLISKPYTFSTGAFIVASEHNNNYDTVYNLVNGNIEDANVKSGAAIASSKIDYTNATISGLSKLIVKDPVFDVRAYEAVGDGSTDDTTAIQDAIDAAELAGGGIVFFPTGNYKITSALTLNADYVGLVGLGLKSCIYQATVDTDILQIAKSVSGGAAHYYNFVRDMSLIAIKGDSKGISAEEAHYLDLRNLYICSGWRDDTKGYGIYIKKCYWGNIDGIKIAETGARPYSNSTDAPYYGIYFTTSCSLWTVKDCAIYYCGKGLVAYQAASASIRHSDFSNIYLSACTVYGMDFYNASLNTFSALNYEGNVADIIIDNMSESTFLSLHGNDITLGSNSNANTFISCQMTNTYTIAGLRNAFINCGQESATPPVDTGTETLWINFQDITTTPTPIYRNRCVVPLQALANDATPSILGADKWKTGGTTTITDFDDGYEGQIITIVAEHSITITDGTNILLNGSANFDMVATDTLTLIQKADGKWYEIGRSDNT